MFPPFLFRDWQFQVQYRKDRHIHQNQDHMVFNDCFYTAMEHNFDFVATLDVDEVSYKTQVISSHFVKQNNPMSTVSIK